MTLRLKNEAAIQAQCMALLRKRGVFAFHPPNEGKHKAQYRRRQIVMGLEPGASDIVILQPPPLWPGYHGAVLELKNYGNKPTIDQWVFLHRAASHGYAWGWAMGLPPAIFQLVAWGYLPAEDLETLAPLARPDHV